MYTKPDVVLFILFITTARTHTNALIDVTATVTANRIVFFLCKIRFFSGKWFFLQIAHKIF